MINPARGLLRTPHSVPWNQSQLGSVLEEHIPGRLLGIDPNSVIGDDGAAIICILMIDKKDTRNIETDLVAGGTLNSSAANLSTAVKGVASGTESTLKGSLGSEVRVILKVTLEPGAAILTKLGMSEMEI